MKAGWMASLSLRVFLAVLMHLCWMDVLSQASTSIPEVVIAEGSSFRGMSVVNSRICWLGGNKGNVFRTTDGGRKWQKVPAPGGDTLEFRDVHALSASEAWLMAAGKGKLSRIYHTSDGGASWDTQFLMQDSLGFLDVIYFWDAQNGIVVGDPVNGKLDVLVTEDGGAHWNRLPQDSRPPAIAGEQIFAASGTSLAVHGDHAWIATGGSVARVFRSADRGRSWQVSETEMPHGIISQGIFSICMMDEMSGVIVGGDYAKDDSLTINLLVTSDGGVTWQPRDTLPFLSCVDVQGGMIAVAGSAFSRYSIGKEEVSGGGFHVVSISPDLKRVFAAGRGGRVSAFRIPASWRRMAKTVEF